MGAELINSTPQPIYAQTGKNYAPVRPIEEAKAQGLTWNQTPLAEALADKYLDYKSRDYQAWKDVVDIGQMVSNLREGKMLLLRNVRDGRYMFVKRDGKFSDHKTAGGLFQFYCTKLTAEWLSSRPERDPVVPSDDDRVEEFISTVKVIQDNYDRAFFDDAYESKESLSAQDFGTWITRFRFDPDKQDIVCELLPFPACRWDIRFRPEESSYFIYESKCSTAKLKHLLQFDIQSDGASADQYGLQIIEQIARQGGNVAGNGKERPYGQFDLVRDESVVSEMWLQPEEYCDIDLPADEDTLCGCEIPAGTSLLELFPKGMCVVGINNMQTIIGIYAEDHREHIVSGIYHAQSFSGLGKGVSDAVDVKKEMDDLHSQIMAYIKAHGTPAYAYNKNIVSEQEARKIGKPKALIAMDFTNAPDGVNNVNQAIQQMIPGNPAQGVFTYQSVLENLLQMSFQVTSFSNGMPGVDNKTATGAQIGESNAAQLLVPQHRNKADHRKRADKVIFNLFKKYMNKGRWFKFRDINNITKSKYITSAEFDGVDVDFEIVADSEVPRSRFTKELSLTRLLQFTGGVGGLLQAAQMDPELTGSISQTFGVSLPIASPDKIARVCRQRIEQAKQALEREMVVGEMMAAVTGEPPDTANLPQRIVDSLIPPIGPAEPHAELKITWLSSLLDDDEMMYAPNELRAVIAEMINRHAQAAALGQAIMAQNQSAATFMGNLPAMLGEQVMSNEAQQMGQQFAMEQAQQQAQMQAQQGQMDAQAQREQALAKEDEADNNAARQIQVQAAKADMDEQRAQADHARQLELANASPVR